MTLLAAIVAMARSLGLSLVAEGIEDEGQARALRRLGCDEGQGFLYWRPMPAGAVDDLLANANTPLLSTGSLIERYAPVESALPLRYDTSNPATASGSSPTSTLTT
jgi:predicted signal transduction protein with EAL and GGDEF domain